jgi:uncharacterized protein (TIGR02246 family)
MSTQASKLVAQAKQWATYYGDFTTGDEAAAYTSPLRARAAWDAGDADALAAEFVENGSWLAGDEQLNGRDRIREYWAEGLAGPYQGSRLTERPIDIKLVTEDVALVVTDGGFLYAGETELPEEREVRATWVVVKKDGDWRLASYQSSPIKG